MAILPRLNAKQKSLLFVSFIIVFLAAYSLGSVFAAGSISDTTIEAGSLVSSAAYIIFTEGDTYYARNGVTGAIDKANSDAYTTIQYALTYGDSIFIKDGDYYLTTGLTRSSDTAVKIDGEGKGSHLIANANIDIITISGTGLYPLGNKHSIIQNLYFTGNGSSHTESAIKLVNCTSPSILNNYFDECYDAIELDSGGDSAISFNSITAWYHAGIVSSSSYENRIVSNHLFSSKGSAVGAANKKGITSASGQNIIADNCIEHVDGASADGIYSTGYYDTITGNTIDSMERHGIVVNYNSSVTDNRCWYNGGYGITAYGDDNTISENRCFDNMEYGIRLEATSDDSYVTNNYLHGNTAGSILVDGTGIFRDNNGFVTENWGSSTGTGGEQQIAHGLAGTPDYVFITNIEDGANGYLSSASNSTHMHITAVINQDYNWYAVYEP